VCLHTVVQHALITCLQPLAHAIEYGIFQHSETVRLRSELVAYRGCARAVMCCLCVQTRTQRRLCARASLLRCVRVASIKRSTQRSRLPSARACVRA
jgi:hypothetical protein